MKIILEDVQNEETEVIIRGNLADSKVQRIISLIKDGNVSSRLIVFDDSKELLTDIKDIYMFEVRERKVFASTSGGKFQCKYSLSEIIALFRNQGMVQIGKSLLVNVRHVKSLEAEFSGNYVVTLRNDEKLIASRFYMKEFRNAILEV